MTGNSKVKDKKKKAVEQPNDENEELAVKIISEWDDLVGTETIQDLLEIRRVGLRHDEFEKWVISIWDVWFQRNKLLNGEECRQPWEMVEFTNSFLTRMVEAPRVLTEPLGRLSICQ